MQILDISGRCFPPSGCNRRLPYSYEIDLYALFPFKPRNILRKCFCICHTCSYPLLKGRVHCFSMQVVMNKYFLLNPEKILAQIRLVVFEINAKNAPLISKNDVTEPKARLL